jgi:hypothetical protein
MIASRLAAAAASYGEVIRRPRYVPLWLGQLVSNFGDTLHYIRAACYRCWKKSWSCTTSGSRSPRTETDRRSEGPSEADGAATRPVYRDVGTALADGQRSGEVGPGAPRCPPLRPLSRPGRAAPVHETSRFVVERDAGGIGRRECRLARLRASHRAAVPVAGRDAASRLGHDRNCSFEQRALTRELIERIKELRTARRALVDRGISASRRDKRRCQEQRQVAVR